MPAPLHLPVPGRHALDGGCPSWCDPRRCVRGQIHIGTPTYWPSTVGDLEFGLARYQADGQSEAFLLTLRALEAELYFYSRIFGFGLADPVEPVPIDNLPTE